MSKGKPRRDNKREQAPKEYEEEVLQIDRVTRVVKGGRRLRFRATIVIGNKKGRVGIGLGKSKEVMGAIQKAVAEAKKNLITVPMINGTIPHDIKMKFKSARLYLMPASSGTGIIAGGAVRRIAELAGIENIMAKSFGCSNKVTNAKATIIALKSLVPPKKKESPETPKA